MLSTLRTSQTGEAWKRATTNHKYLIPSIPEHALSGHGFPPFLHVGLGPTSALIHLVMGLKHLVYRPDLYSASRLSGSPFEFAHRCGQH